MRYHYQIKKEESTLYDSRVNLGFTGFNTGQGAKTAAKAQLDWFNLNEDEYKILIIPINDEYDNNTEH